MDGKISFLVSISVSSVISVYTVSTCRRSFYTIFYIFSVPFIDLQFSVFLFSWQFEFYFFNFGSVRCYFSGAACILLIYIDVINGKCYSVNIFSNLARYGTFNSAPWVVMFIYFIYSCVIQLSKLLFHN